MKITGLLLLFLLLLLAIPAQADSVTLSVCQYPNGTFQFAYTGTINGWWFNAAVSYDLDALTATGEGVEFVVYYDGTTESIFGYEGVANCPDTTALWKPSAPVIFIPAPGPGPYLVEIWDGWHWGLVTDDHHPAGIVLYNKGGQVELIGSIGQDTDPTHYRLIEITP